MTTITCCGCGKSETPPSNGTPDGWTESVRPKKTLEFYDGIPIVIGVAVFRCPECTDKLRKLAGTFVEKLEAVSAHSVTELPRGISMADVNEALDRAGMGEE